MPSGLVGGGLVGVPIAANAEASRLAVSFDHCSYNAWVTGSGFVLTGDACGDAAPF